VRGTKTDAAERTVEILPALRDDLAALAAGRGERPADQRVFGTRSGEAQSQSNVRSRVLVPAIKRANEALEASGSALLPDGVTPHALRRTFASILVALGRDPAVVMRQMGHTTPHMTLGVYAAAMDWRDGERERLRLLVEGGRGIDVVQQSRVELPDGLVVRPPEAVVTDEQSEREERD
jgi:integrase